MQRIYYHYGRKKYFVKITGLPESISFFHYKFFFHCSKLVLANHFFAFLYFFPIEQKFLMYSLLISDITVVN